jgi:hypoxanthine-guanine phosphoribosyltransferase
VDDWIETCSSMKVVVDILKKEVKVKNISIATVLDDSSGRSEKYFNEFDLVRLAVK